MERTAPETWRIAVLTSGHGRGSNLRALHRYFQENKLLIRICFATASDASAPVVELCRKLGVPCHVLKPRPRAEFERLLVDLCREEGADLIALAGFMSLLSDEFISEVRIPILNIHPALLPKYGGRGMYGMKVHEAVFNSGEDISGASVHIVDPIYDHGKVIAREEVDITDCRSPSEVAEKVLKAEHRIYAPAIYNYLRKHHQ
ncbi:MAG: phosphoribosylglycinamide formyltransferase [Candidatus Syntrophosphaera sp.]